MLNDMTIGSFIGFIIGIVIVWAVAAYGDNNDYYTNGPPSH